MSKKLWGGRFTKKTHPLVEEFTRSVQYDHKLAAYDVFGSMAHVQILKKAGYLTAGEALKLTAALGAIYKSIANGVFVHDKNTEDIHTDIQNRLLKKAGDVALKLHTARSRNDQVVFSTKVYCKVEIAKIIAGISSLQSAFNGLAAKNKDMAMPGFTHMQHAQPVKVSDYLGAYVKMLGRDKARLAAIPDSIKLTMGSGALSGTPIEAAKYNISVSGIKITAPVNSMDSVSDRDFVIEILSAVSILGTHLSRFAEDIIIWSSKEFSFVEIDDAFCTGSSLMPQKKNPDVLELIRGYAGRLYGNLLSVLTMMKGLPLSYNRDMQLDKEPLFNSVEIAELSLDVMAALVKSMKLNKSNIEAYLEDESLYATDLVYYLVKKGVAFKNAHTTIGNLIKYTADNGIEIKSMTQRELERFSDKFVKGDIIKLFNPKISVESKKSIKRS